MKEIEWVNPKELKFNPKNRNIHSDEQIERLAKLIQHQGWRWPIIARRYDSMIGAGHGRVLAALKLNLERVPVSFQDWETEEQFYAFLISDNSIASWALLDLAGVNADIGELGPEFDLDLLGIYNFTVDVADKLKAEEDAPLDEKCIPLCKNCGLPVA